MIDFSDYIEQDETALEEECGNYDDHLDHYSDSSPYWSRDNN